MINETHDAARRSWVASANGDSEFPLQNLPFGVFSPPGNAPHGGHPRGGIAIGDMILDLRAASEAGLFSGDAANAAHAAAGTSLNRLMGLGAGARRELRRQTFAVLAEDGEGPRQGRTARIPPAAPRRRLFAAPARGQPQLHRLLRLEQSVTSERRHFGAVNQQKGRNHADGTQLASDPSRHGRSSGRKIGYTGSHGGQRKLPNRLRSQERAPNIWCPFFGSRCVP